MSIATISFLFDLGVVTFLALMLVFCMIFFAHILMPKKLLTTYFTTPYFREGEIIIFTGFPFWYIRTVMFMRLLANPSSGAKRGLTQAFELAPSWLRLYSKLTLLSFYAVGGLFMSITLIFIFEFFIIHPELHKNL